MKPNLRLSARVFSVIWFVLAASVMVHAQCTTNIALGKQATASSVASGNNAGDAVDGNGSSRWESVAADPQNLDVDLGDLYNICQVEIAWENASARDFTIQVSNDGASWSTVASITNNAVYTNSFILSTSGRYVRMHGTARTTGYGYSIYEIRIYGALASGITCPAVNLANGHTGMASSVGNPGNSIANAFDNNLSTRWESLSVDPQWIYIDLGARYDICQVTLNWEAAYGRNFQIEFSNDAVGWTNVRTISNNTSLINNIPLTGVARYIRMYGLTRATAFGYSLWEFRAFGSLNVLPVKLEYFRAHTAGKTILLEWASHHEASSAWFEIQRSNTEQNGFVALGRVAAAGNKQERTTYNFTDPLAPAGRSYYRLKQVDVDGIITYSAVAVAVLNEGNELQPTVATLYNRSSNQVFFKNTIAANRDFSARVYSAEGKLLLCTYDVSKPISMTSYDPGIYIIVVNADGRQFSTRILR